MMTELTFLGELSLQKPIKTALIDTWFSNQTRLTRPPQKPQKPVPAVQPASVSDTEITEQSFVIL